MRLRLATAGIIALVSLACARKSDAPHRDVVKIADRGFLTNAPIYIAEEEGYFADEGIKLEFAEPPRSSSQIIPLLERGDLDVMATALTAGFYAALEQGARSRIVADRGHADATGCDYNGIMLRHGLLNGKSATANDLRGKRFSAGPGGIGAYVLDRYLASVGLTTADVTMLRLGETVEAQALNAGSIDGLHGAEPHLSQLIAEGHDLIGPARIYAPGLHYAVLLFGPTLTVKHRDLGERFMKAYLRGVKKFREGKTPRNIDIIARRAHLTPQVLEKVCLPTVNANGELNPASLLDFQAWLVRSGFLKRAPGAEAGTDMTFARKAAKELGIAQTPR